MTIGQSLLPEFTQEMATTRRVLERVPSDKPDWKPHPKSFSMAHLAQLIATMPGWVTSILRETSLDLGGFAGYSNQLTTALLETFDRSVREAAAALGAARDADFDVTWSLKRGSMVLMSMPRAVVYRQTISHIVHHRGQMTVYLRLNDVAVPSVYGPTADERFPTPPA